MSNNKDVLDKTREMPSVSLGENTDVHKDQSSLFDTEDAFSESMVVEKENVQINSSENAHSLGDTAVFSFPKKEELSAKELQDNAKNFFNATHSDNIEDKISELQRLADENFNDDFEVDSAEDVFGEEPVAYESNKSNKKKKKDKKKKKKGYVSDDDINMLMGVGEIEHKETAQDVFSDEEAFEDLGVVAEDGSTEYTNPLNQQEEDEEDKLISALGVKGKKFKTFEAVFENDELEEEYTDRDQEEEILAKLRKKAIFSCISIAVTAILTILCLYFESAAGTSMPHPSFFDPGKYGVTYAMSMLQIMFVCVIFNFDGIARGFKGFVPSKASVESYSAAAVVVCTIHSVLSCFAPKDSADIVSYCSVGCLAMLVLSVNSFMKAYTTLGSFCIAASKHPKYASVDLGVESLEGRSFEKYLDADTGVITVGKSDFVKGFFKKQETKPHASKSSVKMTVILLIVSLVVAIVSGIFGSAYAGICTFTVMSLGAIPANALLSTVLPFFLACGKAKRTQTAYIGEAACDMYENTGVVSFDDTEVFPARNVKVSSIRTYGENRIDKVILYMAKIFSKVGGPLSFVFANSIQSVDDFGDEAQISEHFSNGINTKVDGKEVLVGTSDFLKLYDIDAPFDNIDESFTQSLGSIMYMAVDGEIAAKFYIKYTMNRGFEAMLHSFYDAGICVGIKTLDPCITTELVCANLKGSNYPVSVIKVYTRQDDDKVNESTSGSIISLSSVHNFLAGFIRLDNLRNVYRSNTYVSFASMIIGLALSAFMCVSGSLGQSMNMVGALTVALFQILWCLPTVLLSVFSNK